MPSGCCAGSTCSCQIVTEGRLTIEGSGQPGDPFILNAAAEFDPWGNTTFLTDVVGLGTLDVPWQVQVGYAPTAKLDDIPNVDTGAPANGQVLTWDSATATWKASPPAVAPVGAVTHDSSLTGDGSAGAPLGVAPYGARYLGSFPQGIGLNDQGMTSVVHHFANATDRSTAFPVPGYNTLSMLDTNPGVIEYWTSTAWSPLPNQTGWFAEEAFLELSGPYALGIPITFMVLQVEGTTDANGMMDVVTPADLAGRSGVLSTQIQETGAVAWKAMVFDNTDRVSITAYRLTDGSTMAGVPLTCTVNAITY